MASPRRSNRGGHSKGGRKKEDEDDGGHTRCVCNQQHHEGVMIQCETCKVWQHCPCVGLGDGEVTPDKYYCDSCRPENHPYKVVDGQLISNSKSSLASKTTKKRSTMNSKEASIPMDLMLAQQKWNEEHQDELDDDFAQRAPSKRRKKTESISTDLEDDSAHHGSSKESDPATATPSAAPQVVSPSTSLSASSGDKKKGAGPTSNQQDSHTPVSSTLSRRQPSPKTTRKDNEDIATVPNNSAQSDMQAPTHSVTSPAPSSHKKVYPRRGGDRAHNARNGSRSSTPVPTTEGTPQPMAPATPATVRYPSSKMTIQEMTKRAKQLLDYISRVQIDLADRKSKSSSSSPQDDVSSTPRMGGSAQSLCHPHQPTTSYQQHKNAETTDSTVFQLLTPLKVSVMHGDSQVCPDLSRSSMDSTASSMDGVQEPSSPVDTKVPFKEAMAAKEMSIKVVPLDSRNSVPLLSTPPLSVHDQHHPHHPHHSNHHERRGSGTPESEATHEPLTPPHHPSEVDDRGRPKDSKHRMSLDGGDIEMKAGPVMVTSLELMDKLTGDLIRFQDKFGIHG
ncbi:hypothetical protein BGZ99_006792 [Dissophora globulifera]|uniref:Zinc finger PHD-type domain-containing protein n=1 Tax=Dissophora globulifera TaxID=979702 RepID=A0A9P6RS94_9FUNG|nr:hypothetical protein BGZ99_006792 [Dissophora globulifera]